MCSCVFVPGQQVESSGYVISVWCSLCHVSPHFLVNSVRILIWWRLMTFMSFVFWEITTVFGWYVTQICFLFDDVLPCFTHVLLPEKRVLPVRVLSGIQDKDADARQAASSWLGNNPNISKLWKDHVYIYIWYVLICILSNKHNNHNNPTIKPIWWSTMI